MKSITKINNNNSLFITLILWYYRLFGITFGGLVLNKTQECVVNKYLNIFGFMTTFFIIIIINLENIFIIKVRFLNLDKLYNSGFITIYYLSLFSSLLSRIYCNFSSGYYQFKASKLFTVLQTYPINRIRNKIIIYTSFVIAITFQLLIIYFCFKPIQKLFSQTNAISVIISFHLYYESIVESTISIITWGKNNQFSNFDYSLP